MAKFFIYIQNGSQKFKINIRTRCAKINTIRHLLSKDHGIATEKQKLYFKGKELLDELTIFDYQVNYEDTITLVVKSGVQSSPRKDNFSDELTKALTNDVEDRTLEVDLREDAESFYYQIGDLVDCQCSDSNAFFEARINGIKKNPQVEILDFKNINNEGCFAHELIPDGLIYIVESKYHLVSHQKLELKIYQIRPRPRAAIAFENLEIGTTYMVNYNVDEQDNNHGLFYDAVITQISNGRRKALKGTIIINHDSPPKEVTIKFHDQIFAIEKVFPIAFRDEQLITLLTKGCSVPRKYKSECDECLDDPSTLCRFCSCTFCGLKENPELQLLCEECDRASHTYCNTPKLEKIPPGDWYCIECKTDDSEIVKPGENLKETKKRKSAPSSIAKKAWGGGMACVGVRTKTRPVPADHFGPIPGINVGSSWLFRAQVSEAGVHLPPVAGIHGRAETGAFSIVMSRGYEDDIDEGDSFWYTGSGGRELRSNNRRTAKQSADQKLTLDNRALALNCQAKINEAGAEAKDWQKGKPVRVVRGALKNKKSVCKFRPKVGYRYDGIYRVVKYEFVKGQSGFGVYRFQLRRDDPAPAPWTPKGIARIKTLGLKIKVPDGYEELEEEHISKRPKLSVYSLPVKIQKLISKDKVNEKLWNKTMEVLTEGELIYLKKVEEMFICAICQDLLVSPVTLECSHSFCKSCLDRSYKLETTCCSLCRQTFGNPTLLKINENLKIILQNLFPGF